MNDTKENNEKSFEKLMEQFAFAVQNQDWEKASAALNHAWMFFHLMITPITNPDLKELNYFKVPITTSEGGQYLLSLNHVSGEKIKFGNSDIYVTQEVSAQEHK